MISCARLVSRDCIFYVGTDRLLRPGGEGGRGEGRSQKCGVSKLGRVGENPGNEVENSDAIKEVRSKGRDVYPSDRQILL